MPNISFIDSLFPPGLPKVADWLDRYPPRTLPAGAQVTRVAPSPTGHLHIGGIYAAMICKDLAAHSGGTFFARIEDTDQSREVPGAVAQFSRAFAYFGLTPDEDDATVAYGPYTQSARATIYLSFVRQLLRTGRAYLCFATKEDLAGIAAQQKAAKDTPGYYGRWALWRDAAEHQVAEALVAGKPYTVRFRSPGVPGARMTFSDAIRGRIEMQDNYTDPVILKSSGSPLRLPTYHLAHVADDILMRVTLVLRGEEWIPSTPLHLQMFAALGLPPVRYAHIAHLLKVDGRSKRKLSKRHDPEASVDFYIEAGYPAEPVMHYLRGLANGRLAEMPSHVALAQPLRLTECGSSGALLDVAKLDSLCADFIAELPSVVVLGRITAWAAQYDPGLAEVLATHEDRALAALRVERDGHKSPRKDLKRWAQFRELYGFFFPPLFMPVSTLDGTLLANISAGAARLFTAGLAESYAHDDDPVTWFAQIRERAARSGFAATAADYKADPSRYAGTVRDAAQMVRLALTGSTRSPDLHAVAMVLGRSEVISRLEHMST